MIHSYKGGSGKTLFSVNIANLLQRSFKKRVLLIEADFSMPVFHNIFRNHNPDIYFNDYLNQTGISLEKLIYPDLENGLGIIFCNPVFSPNDMVLTTDTKWYETVVNRLGSDLSQLEYDYVIFDLSPGKNLFTATVLLLSDKIFTILRPDFYSVEGIKSLYRDFYSSVSRLVNKEFHIIMNQIPVHEGMTAIVDNWKESIMQLYSNINTFNTIDFDHSTGYAVSNGNLLLELNDPTCQNILSIIYLVFTD